MNHTPYVEATQTALSEHHIPVTQVHTHTRPYRYARLELDTHLSGCTYAPLEALWLSWNESHGWSLNLILTNTGGRQSATIYRGIDILPAPISLASWTRLTLSMPSVTESRPHHGLPIHAHTSEPDLEARLATIADDAE